MNTKMLNADTAAVWVQDYADEMLGFVLARVRDRLAAEDLVQEAFLAAWRNRDQYDPMQSPRTWLFHILRNKLIDYYRKDGRRATEALVESGDWDGTPYFDSAGHWAESHYPADVHWEASSRLNQKDFLVVLADCQGRLQTRQLAVFTMKYIDELESQQICEALGISDSNYWVLLHRAKLQLRACLEALWYKH